ncbi:MAG: hypothetical protein ACE5JX_14515 [Acidobacteriota bacterium]
MSSNKKFFSNQGKETSAMRSDAPCKESIPAGARIYTLAVTAVGLSLFGYCLYLGLTQMKLHWLYLAPLTVLASCFPIKIPALRERMQSLSVTIGDIFVFAGLLLFGPPVGAVLALLEGLTSSLRVKVRDTYKLLFNLGQLALVAFVVGQLLGLLEGGLASLMTSQYQPAFRMLPEIGLAALLYFLLNSGCVAVAMTLTTGESLPRLWRQNFVCALPATVLNGLTAALVFVLAATDLFTSGLMVSLILMMYYFLALWLKKRAAAASLPLTG